jgi:4-hydroxyphenylpyruvate dioxygenase
LRVGYEALAWGRYINDHRDAWEIVRRADHPNVGLVLDSFHTLARRIDVASIRSIPRDKIFIVQLADAPLIDMDLMYWSRHLRNMPGQGDLPVTKFTQAVVATGYDGVLSLEIFNDQFRGSSPRSIATDGRRSLVYTMDQVRCMEPDIAPAVPKIPPRVGVDGIEFIEFATNDSQAGELARIFHALGFRKVGTHRTKDVTVYRQAGINLLINTARTGFAHSSYVVHGTSAYAVGLKVENAAAAVARASALGAALFDQPSGPGEAVLPAIRGVGGGLLYFVDDKSTPARIWETDFIPAADAVAVQDCGLIAVDHVAQTMTSDEMLSWLLFYVSLFDVTKTSVVDIADPAGLVRSQVVENASGTLRLTLNGAENARTFAGHFIAESFGSSVQHIALRTEDIFATARALQANGFKTLPISHNYYDDIEARFGLEAAFVETLAAHNILYDQDGTGEYFQIFGPNFGEGFFFEIVQRRIYRGYGAANAPFRIAAQTRELRQKTPL